MKSMIGNSIKREDVLELQMDIVTDFWYKNHNRKK